MGVRLLRNSKYFYRDGQARDTHMKIFHWPTLQLLFSGTNNNIEKASHPFVVYYIVIDKVQFVWMFALMRRLVIQLSENHQVCV